MPMRDFQHLEELSTTAALGLWADDVVLAVDAAISGAPLSSGRASLLRDAAETVEATLRWTEQPLHTPKAAHAHALATAETALTIVTALVQGEPAEDQRAFLGSVVEVLREAAAGHLTQDDSERVNPVMQLFGMVGEHQLVASNAVLTARKEMWTGTQAISSSF
jgi:hypothetical protein